jgi:hypothetical protein
MRDEPFPLTALGVVALLAAAAVLIVVAMVILK